MAAEPHHVVLVCPATTGTLVKRSTLDVFTANFEAAYFSSEMCYGSAQISS